MLPMRIPFIVLTVLSTVFIWYTATALEFRILRYSPKAFGTINISPRHNDTVLRALHNGLEKDDNDRKKFMKDALQSEPYDLSSLRQLCDKTKWTNKVVFTCDTNAGGIGNVRNHILNCIRYTIEAGGSLVMPQIIVRNKKDIINIYTDNRAGMEYLFDKSHFTESLQTYCPQLQIYDEAPTGKTMKLLPESLDSLTKTGLRHPGEWRQKFDRWFKKHSVGVVHQFRSYLTFPIHHDSRSFSDNFGQLLHFQTEARRLAAAALYNLHKISLTSFDVTQTTIPNLYLGTHLRTEVDALHFWSRWPYGTWDEQTDAFIQQAIQTNLSLVYVASGEEDEIDRFRRKAPELTIISKEDLLGEEDRSTLQSMTFDQQALVDYIILSKASSFGGVAQSSFSWNIALKRHIWSGAEDRLDGPLILSDELSIIYGKSRKQSKYEACMWP